MKRILIITLSLSIFTSCSYLEDPHSNNIETPSKSDVIYISNFETLDVERDISSDGILDTDYYVELFEDDSIFLSVLDDSCKSTYRTIYEYHIGKKTISYLFSTEFDISYWPDYYYKGYYFTLPCTVEDNKLIMHVIVSDTKNKITNVIAEIEVTSPYYYIKSIDETSVAFMIFSENGQSTSQSIFKYDIINGNTTEIYHHEYVEENQYNAWTFDTWNGNIYILSTKANDSFRSWEIYCINSDGKEIMREELMGLDSYSIPECSVNQLTVCDDLYMLQFYNSANNAGFICLDRCDFTSNYQFGAYMPCSLLQKNNNYLVFDTYPDNEDYVSGNYSTSICVFDLADNSYNFLKFNISGNNIPRDIFVNEYGDILICVYSDKDKGNRILLKKNALDDIV